MSALFDRALLLAEQGRFEMAEAEVRRHLAEVPDHAFGHALLALCLITRESWGEATTEAQQAIALQPDLAFAHFIQARVLRGRNRTDEALATVMEAIRIDGCDADFFWLLGALKADVGAWAQALEAAERGLQVDAEHVDCANLRALALVHLGRRGEAGQALDAALSKDPENSTTHANVGWTRLHESRPREALESFREALRLDPENEWARAGIVEALKARNPVYGLLLRYFLWMSRLGHNTRWGIVVGGYLGYRLLAAVEQANPAIAPATFALRVFYVGFVFLSWTAQPLFNLLLRLNRFGRLALSEEQVRASNWVGAVAGLVVAGVAACLVRGFDGPPLLGLFTAAGLLIPTAATFNCHEGWPRRTMAWITVVIGLSGLGLFVESLMPEQVSGRWWVLDSLVAAMTLVFIAGAITAPWVANLLTSRRPRR